MLLIEGPPVSGDRPDEPHVEGVVGPPLATHEARLQVIQFVLLASSPGR